jgi:hypothetical protein
MGYAVHRRSPIMVSNLNVAHAPPCSYSDKI